MTANRSFIVKNGLEVAEDLIFADGSKQQVGIGTTISLYTVDVYGDVALTGKLFTPPISVGVGTATGTIVGGQNNFIVGVNTSLFRVNDIINNGPFLSANTRVTSIGATSIGISPPHTRLSGSSITTLTITRRVTSGVDGQILVSRGANLSPYWKTLDEEVEIEESSSSSTQYLTFVDGDGQRLLKINSNQLVFIPSTGNLGIGITNPDFKLDVVGDGAFSGTVFAALFSGNVSSNIVDTDNLFVVNNAVFDSDVIVSSGNIGIGSTLPKSRLDVIGNARISGIITAQQFSGTATTAINSTVKTSNSSSVSYPTFVIGSGSTILDINTTKITFIASSASLGIGTNSPTKNLDVIGDVSLTNRFFATAKPQLIKTAQGFLSNTNNNFIGVNTTGIQIGDVVSGDFITSGTTITSIGSTGVNITPPHGVLVVGPIERTISFFVPETNSPGIDGQILVSRGPASSVVWSDIQDIVSTTVTDSNENKIFFPIFSSVTSGVSTLTVDSTGLAYNPSTNRLGIGTTNPSTSLDVNGSVNALSYFGDGVNLAGIVTQIVSGIGVSITPISGKGLVTIESYTPTGKTIYVNQNGDDENTGLSENHAKRTIKAAANTAIFGDTIKVFPGVYVEENPIILKKTVSVEGTELRNCVVTPKYSYLDLFHVNNGCHITDISFIGPEMTDGASVVALQPLEGVSVDRYFDAARLIRTNLDFIANEAVGFLTSSQYIGAGRTQITDPTFTVVNSSGVSTDPVNCSDDIKSILKCVIHDITRGGNSRCVDAGKSYYDDEFNLLHITGTDVNGYSVKDATIDTINYTAGIARAIVNNVTWGGQPVGLGTTVSNALYNENTGITTITVNSHGLLKDDAVKIVGLAFTCPSGPGIVTYPSGSLGYIFNVLDVLDNNNFEVIVGQSTLPHTYVSGGTIQKYEKFGHDYYQVKDVSIQPDPLTGFNNGINGCANVISAIYSCVGIVTNIIGLGSSAFNTVGIKTTYPGNSGVGFTSIRSISSADYDETTGKTTIIAPGINVVEGDQIELRELAFSCASNGSGISTQIFPSGKYGYDFSVDKVNLDGSFEVYVGPSTLPHTYEGGGLVVDRTVAISTAFYDNTTGVTTITAPGAFVRQGDLVTIRDLEFSCPSGPGIVTYPSGSEGFTFRVNQVIGVGSTFVITVGVSTLPHFYQGNGIVIPPFSRGVGPITQGPYVRNCTNFIPKSIGMKVDGFDAEPGDKDDIGVTGTMSVDSYTQYNQGGIGVSITNGAYAQLVSIFTICDDIAIFTGSGGQCDITNSNSSFGNLGLVSDGVGDAISGSIYRYTGIAASALADQSIVQISGVGKQRPYDGQALYFGELYYEVRSIRVTNGGFGYTQPPRVVIDLPTGPSGIRAEATSSIDAFGRVSSIDIISTGSQYRLSDLPTITIDPPSGPGSTATAELELYPLYYTIESATLPASGISTVTLNTNLNNNVSAGTTVYFTRLSLQIVSSHSFEWVGAGNDINIAKPALGGVVKQENEVVKLNGGEVFYTSTDQAGNFRIGDGFVINQLTGTVTGRAFNQSILNNVTPLIIALGK